MASSSTTITPTTASAADPNPARVAPPTTSTPRIGRYSAIVRSSITQTVTTNCAALPPDHPRSEMIFAATPDDVTSVTPPRKSDVTSPKSSRNPARNPGVKLSTRSSTAMGTERADRRDEVAGRVLEAEHEEQEDETDLAADLDEDVVVPSGRRPPSPNASPARR